MYAGQGSWLSLTTFKCRAGTRLSVPNHFPFRDLASLDQVSHMTPDTRHLVRQLLPSAFLTMAAQERPGPKTQQLEYQHLCERIQYFVAAACHVAVAEHTAWRFGETNGTSQIDGNRRECTYNCTVLIQLKSCHASVASLGCKDHLGNGGEIPVGTGGERAS